MLGNLIFSFLIGVTVHNGDNIPLSDTSAHLKGEQDSIVTKSVRTDTIKSNELNIIGNSVILGVPGNIVAPNYVLILGDIAGGVDSSNEYSLNIGCDNHSANNWLSGLFGESSYFYDNYYSLHIGYGSSFKRNEKSFSINSEKKEFDNDYYLGIGVLGRSVNNNTYISIGRSNYDSLNEYSSDLGNSNRSIQNFYNNMYARYSSDSLDSFSIDIGQYNQSISNRFTWQFGQYDTSKNVLFGFAFGEKIKLGGDATEDSFPIVFGKGKVNCSFAYLFGDEETDSNATPHSVKFAMRTVFTDENKFLLGTSATDDSAIYIQAGAKGIISYVNFSYGGYFQASKNYGLYGIANESLGVYGESNWIGIKGLGITDKGVWGETYGNYGVYGQAYDSEANAGRYGGFFWADNIGLACSTGVDTCFWMKNGMGIFDGDIDIENHSIRQIDTAYGYVANFSHYENLPETTIFYDTLGYCDTCGHAKEADTTNFAWLSDTANDAKALSGKTATEFLRSNVPDTGTYIKLDSLKANLTIQDMLRLIPYNGVPGSPVRGTIVMDSTGGDTIKIYMNSQWNAVKLNEDIPPP
jgi:hypothetical protein